MRDHHIAFQIVEQNAERLKADEGAAGAAGSEPFDALIIGLAEGEEGADYVLPSEIEAAVQRLKDAGVFKGKAGEVYSYPILGKSYTFAAFVGIGRIPSSAAYRDAAVYAARHAAKHAWQSVAVLLPALQDSTEAAFARKCCGAFAEGLKLGSFRMRTYRKEEEDTPLLKEVAFLCSDGVSVHTDRLRQAIREGMVMADAINYARDLTNVPGNMLTPNDLAEEAAKLAGQEARVMAGEPAEVNVNQSEVGPDGPAGEIDSAGKPASHVRRSPLTCTILKENEIASLGMGGLEAVGKGSIHPPRMIVLKYQGREEWKDVHALVGKGITFDTGGISLKKGEGMEEMISDMGGAAVVLGVMSALARLQLPVNVLAVIASAENMPSGSAYKPGDVITMLSGRTVEVLNTDAEGRIVLADAVTYAKRLGAERIIDIATLTGAVLVNFGDVATGAVTNDDAFFSEFRAAADRANEKVWQLPAYPEYWDMLKSDVADLKNAPGRHAGTITGGLFIGTFAEETPWIHLDTGGTAWLWHERGTDPKGGTGAMVRSLLEWIHGLK